MKLVKAEAMDWVRINNAIHRKHIDFCTPAQIWDDFGKGRLYAVKEGDKVLATISLVEEPEYGYTAMKRLCILNKKNCGKGIARFALQEIQKEVRGKIGATPWDINMKMRHLLESEGYKLAYIFDGKWCFYVKDV